MHFLETFVTLAILVVDLEIKACGRRNYKRSFEAALLAADPDERRTPRAPFVSRGSAWFPTLLPP